MNLYGDATIDDCDTDRDGDNVDNDVDVCEWTPLGTIVNALLETYLDRRANDAVPAPLFDRIPLDRVSVSMTINATAPWLLAHREGFEAASVLIVVAGMESALPSVVGGMVSRPVIAVPTSVGYGANFGGVAPLLTMLNSCAPGVTVSNIDNGFSAGIAAARVAKAVSTAGRTASDE